MTSRERDCGRKERGLYLHIFNGIFCRFLNRVPHFHFALSFAKLCSWLWLVLPTQSSPAGVAGGGCPYRVSVTPLPLIFLGMFLCSLRENWVRILPVAAFCPLPQCDSPPWAPALWSQAHHFSVCCASAVPLAKPPPPPSPRHKPSIRKLTISPFQHLHLCGTCLCLMGPAPGLLR